MNVHANLDWRSRTVWVTGASSGIGRAVAMRLAQRGAYVFASARRADALAELADQCGVEPLPCDVADRDAVLAAAECIRRESGSLDVLLANAGTCEYVDVAQFDSAPFARVMSANFFGAVHCVEAALPLLRAGRLKTVAAVGSAAAWTGLPRAEAYGASKAALHYFLDSLRVDLTREGFTVCTVAPGFVETPLTDRNDFPMPMRIGVEDAAEAIVRGLGRGDAEIHFPRAFTTPLRALRLLPVSLRNRLYQRLARAS